MLCNYDAQLDAYQNKNSKSGIVSKLTTEIVYLVDLCYVFPWISSWINLWTKLELMDKIETYGQNQTKLNKNKSLPSNLEPSETRKWPELSPTFMVEEEKNKKRNSVS